MAKVSWLAVMSFIDGAPKFKLNTQVFYLDYPIILSLFVWRFSLLVIPILVDS